MNRGSLVVNERTMPVVDVTLMRGGIAIVARVHGPCDLNLTGDVRVHAPDGSVVTSGGRAEIGRVCLTSGEELFVTYVMSVESMNGVKQTW